MKMNKLFKGIEALFTKADTTEARYEQALEKKQMDLIHLQAELQEKNVMLKDMHKMKLLGDVSEEAYKTEAEKVAVLQKAVQELQKEISMIEIYQTEDITALIEELDAEKQRVFKGNQKELEKIRLELLEAKLSYLNKMQEAKARYDELANPERKLDELKIKMGIKKNSYVSDSFEALNQYSLVNGGYEFLRIEQNEVHDALRYGKTPEKLNKIVQEAKEKGMI